MAGSTRFDLSAASPDELAFKGSFPYGQRGNLKNGSLDRSANFHESNERQMFVSGSNVSRGDSTPVGDSAPVAQDLMLDPITMGDQKYTRSGELRRVLGKSFGNTFGDRAVGTRNLKSPPPVATEELKRFKASVQEASVRARYRSKKLDESLQKLSKCWEAVNSKKQRLNEFSPDERLGGSHFSKLRNQTHRSPSELANQRLEDKTRSVILNKRIRTSVAEMRAEGQSNTFVRQPLPTGKDRDNIKDGGNGCDIEEKLRRVPQGGETWDRKVKRKRSVGIVFARSVEGERELKSVMHPKLANESGLQSSDARGLRSGFSGCNSKLDIASLPNSTKACATAMNEQEKVSRDSMDGSNKECVVLDGNKFNVRENNYTGGIYMLTKGRTPRPGPLVAGNLSSVSHSSETLEAREQPSDVNKPDSVNGTINLRCPLPVGSSTSVMAQWVGQRPKKISRTRRANVVSPVLNCDEVHTPLEGCSPSDADDRMTSVNGIQLGGMKQENVSSPTNLSESEESGAGENTERKLKEKGLGNNEVDESAINNSCNISSSALATKIKIPIKEESGDGHGLRRRGRGRRGPSVLKTGVTPMNEKLEISSSLAKPTRNMKPASEKNGSKLGRPPLKKSCDRKALTRLGTNNSPDTAGESGDDREELLAAANFSSNASYIGCSSSFWKKVERNFAPVNLEDIAFLKKLVETTGVDQRCSSQILGLGSDAQDGLTKADNLLSQSPLSRETGRSILSQTDKEISSQVDMVDQHLDDSFLCGPMDSEGNKIPALYQRVLNALVIGDQPDEETFEDENMSFHSDSPQMSCFSQDVEVQPSIQTEYEINSDKVSCKGNSSFTGGKNIKDQELGVFLEAEQGSLHPETESLPMLSENGSAGLMGIHRISSSFSRDFEQMSTEDKLLLELQSVGLYPEPAPDLANGDFEAINQDIIQLQKGLFQQSTKKRGYFMKLVQAVEESREKEQSALEQVALDKLVELAYKKKLATRVSSASRYGLSKVSRPVALAFMKRTLARCRKFEETGKSCFLDPVVKDVLFAAPVRDNYAGLASINQPLAQNSWGESAPSGYFSSREPDVLGNIGHPSDQDFARTGPILNGGKKRELLLDDVGNSFMGGANAKRSGRGREKDTSGRNSVTKRGRSYSRGERKTKAKSKPRTVQATSGNGSPSKLMENTKSEQQVARVSNEPISIGSNRRSEVGSILHNNNTNALSIETKEPMDFTNLHELESIDLGAANALNGDQDLDSWFNIDVDGLQDGDVDGLDIPMDDLSDVNMLL